MTVFLFFLLLRNCLSWNVMVSDPFYENVKLTTSSPPITHLAAQDFSVIKCAMMCSQRSDCRAINWYPGYKGTNVCELLQDNLCNDPFGTSLAFQAQSRVWDQVDSNKSPSCISSICEKVPFDCIGITSQVCDHCTRSCTNCWQRYYNRTSIGRYLCTYWPDGIVGSSVATNCINNDTYVIMRKYLSFGIPDTSYAQYLTIDDVTRVIRTGGYKLIHFVVTKKSIQPRGVYAFDGQGMEEDGRISITFYPSAYPNTNIDVLELNGQSLIKAPFVNTSDVLPSCGPFWLLPQGNATCPGGNIRFWTTPVWLSNGTVVDSGVHFPSAGSPFEYIRACIAVYH